MRKAYISPAMQVVEIHKSDMIVTSPTEVSSNVFGSEISGSDAGARAAGRGWDYYEGF